MRRNQKKKITQKKKTGKKEATFRAIRKHTKFLEHPVYIDIQHKQTVQLFREFFLTPQRESTAITIRIYTDNTPQNLFLKEEEEAFCEKPVIRKVNYIYIQVSIMYKWNLYALIIPSIYFYRYEKFTLSYLK